MAFDGCLVKIVCDLIGRSRGGSREEQERCRDSDGKDCPLLDISEASGLAESEY